ncbi:hypothetical protein C2I06_05355 [Niallia circulans]|uniref:sporulation histidine kinase inhibitor Sda n=1 Tax=Niallia circulans TaxID=1397 RepID=UPI000F44A8F7|nr:sporulation histidine kinase inhibitor Sda [Niallia circulans]AYV66342.1 hypothetical protein C2I06_05355 [Niallia circulans]
MDSLRKLSNDHLMTAYFSAVKLKLSNEFVKILKNEITKRNLLIIKKTNGTYFKKKYHFFIISC